MPPTVTRALQRFLAPPAFDGDERKTRRARLLTLILNAGIVGIPIITIANLIGGHIPAAVIGLDLVFIAVYLIMRWALHRGHVDLAGAGLISLASILITAADAALGTIRTPTTAIYIIVVVASGLMYDRRGIALTVAVSSLEILALIVAENAGWLPRPDLMVTVTQWVSLTAYLILAGGLTYYALLEIRRALHRADLDLAERKLAEASLRESNAELQTRNEELDAFAHTVAHDLKSPIGLMVGFADMLLENYADSFDATIRHALSTITNSGVKASSIIESLLLLASIRKQDLQVEWIEMGRVVDEVLNRLAEPIKSSGAEIHQPDRASWPITRGYGPWVEEIWVNYLSNAIKYGGQQPRIELGAARQNDGFVRFSVRDYGPGLTLDQQQRLFAPFERLGQVQVTGHGLGLSVVRRIADKLGGQVGVDSQPGQGSTFYFTLPAAEPARPS